MENFVEKKCVPCEGGTPHLEQEKVEEYLKEIEGWKVQPSFEEIPDGGKKRISKTFKFKTFREAIDFVNQIANLAEKEGHHPDIHILYRKVTLELTTHAIKGLSENDFIMASKINLMYGWEEKVEKVIVKKMFSVKFLVAVLIVLLLILVLKNQ